VVDTATSAVTSAVTRRAEAADAERAAAIRHHYDVGNDFYALWLDESLTYSCAMPAGPDDSLGAAQARKLDFHLDAVGAGAGQRVLDVGCGWGSVLARLAEHRGARAVGLTLSPEQAAHVRGLRLPGVEVRVEDWAHYQPEAAGGAFDGIISIGAFEHFATPEDSAAERIERYRSFFTRARDWLRPGGTLSLQTIAYGSMPREQASRFIQEEIFPRAELPTISDIATAADGVLEICRLRNDRLDYAWTCEQWASRLRRRRAEAAALVGADVVDRYARYLRMSALGFRLGKIGLLRIVLRALDSSYGGGRAGRS